MVTNTQFYLGKKYSTSSRTYIVRNLKKIVFFQTEIKLGAQKRNKNKQFVQLFRATVGKEVRN